MELKLTGQSIKKVRYARELRKKMTESEKLLWESLRAKKQGCKYRRQVPLGLFVADFCCLKHRILIEVDGGIHEETRERDVMRDQHLASGGFRILHVTNEQVMQRLPEVLALIRHACGES